MLIINTTPPQELEFHYDGIEVLKGVLNDEDYPILWINTMYRDDPDHKDNSICIRIYLLNVMYNILKNFVQHLINNNNYIDLPFIIDNKNNNLVYGKNTKLF